MAAVGGSKDGLPRALAVAVAGIGGTERPGQVAMAEAVADALTSGRHLLVQAGTGTGKSLGYLIPILLRLARDRPDRVVVATATLALQRQLATADIPAALRAVEQVTGRRPEFAVLKGRTNYACRLRVAAEASPGQDALITVDDQATAAPVRAAGSESASPPARSGSVSGSTRSGSPSALGAEVVALREWAEEQHDARGLADRDDAPRHTDRAWQQVSIPVRECLGVARCPYGSTCFVERSREQARAADLVVTNHALLAIDAMHGGTALPEHSAVVVDEAHELVGRITGAASAELSPSLVERVGRRALPYLAEEDALALLESVDTLRTALEASALQRVEDPASPLMAALDTVRAATRRAISALARAEVKAEPEQRQAAAAVKEVFDVVERMVGLSAFDVLWVTDSDRLGREARVAPLSVAGLLRGAVFAERTTILTSATLKLGGDFTATATALGLRADEREEPDIPTFLEGARTPAVGQAPSRTEVGEDRAEAREDRAEAREDRAEAREDRAEEPLPWRGLDVGSPFDYRQQAILYVARRLPPPGRDGLSEVTAAEIAELVWAAGGRTLGLFSSRRAAETAADHVRRHLPRLPVLCQGDAQLPELAARFLAEEPTSLFGTLSLWQGLDVPGPTCSLVVIDRIPFPRPDEPLTLARQRAVAEAGGNGFLTVAGAAAALLLAQGAGRLIRRLDDRGVVAVLDPRLVTARYGAFLRASMPPMWPTVEREVAVAALQRLAARAA